MTALFRELRWLEPVADLLRLGCFAGLAALVILNIDGAIRHLDEGRARRRARALIVYVVVVSTVVGLTQVEAWPFTTWALVHTVRSPEMTSWELEAVSSRGIATIVDPRAFQPMQPEELGAFMLANIGRLSPAARADLMHYLLTRAEEARRNVLRGEFPPDDRILGPLSAPAHFQGRRIWTSPSTVPADPLVAIRLWRYEWNVEARAIDPGAVRRSLLAEYRSDGRS